jgi:hypothetical protein
MIWHHVEDSEVRARKPHRCFLCCEPIAAGELYRRRNGIDEDGHVAMHMHPECEAATHGWDQADWECFSEGDMKRPGTAKGLT